MKSEIKKSIIELQKTPVKKLINLRLKEFTSFENKLSKYWFSELCFCILTANSKALTAIAIQNEIGPDGFLNLSLKKLTQVIRKNNHRFYNNKAKYIVEARKHKNIKKEIQTIVSKDCSSQIKAREFIVENIKGIGFKEASHFLRNVGYFELAILDRHILNLMVEFKLIKEKPKTLNKKNYFLIEEKFLNFAKELKMQPAELDVYMWYLKVGAVLK